MATRAELRRLSDATRDIQRLADRDVRRLWRMVRDDNPRRVREALEDLLPDLVAAYGEVSAAVAADWYDEVREASGVRGGFTALLADPVEPDRVRANARWAIGPLFSAEPDWDAALANLTPEVDRMAMQPGRDTITRSTDLDPRAVGWQRITSAGACKFCVGLAARGAVYKQSTVRFAAHTNCSCSASPSWDATAPEVPAEAYQASARTSTMSEEQLLAHRARTREWLNSEFPDVRG